MSSMGGDDLFQKVKSPTKKQLSKKNSLLSVEDEEGNSSNSSSNENANSSDDEIIIDNGNLDLGDPQSLLDSYKHPLQDTWVMWYDQATKKTDQGNWLDNLKTVCEFSYVEDFWAMYNHLVVPSKLSMGANYHCFRKGIIPAWEQEANKNGGKWIYTIRKENKHSLDDLWLGTVLACIGDQFDGADEVNGAVMSIRSKGDKICLWTKTASDEDITRRMGTIFKTVLGLELQDTKHKITYQIHSDAMRRGTSYNNKARLEL